MKNKYFFIIIFVLINSINTIFANEIIIESKDINILENGNKIISGRGVANSIEDNLTIKANNKKSGIKVEA